MTNIETVFWQDQIAGLNDESLTAIMDHWFHENPTDWVVVVRKLIKAEWRGRAKPALAA